MGGHIIMTVIYLFCFVLFLSPLLLLDCPSPCASPSFSVPFPSYSSVNAKYLGRKRSLLLLLCKLAECCGLCTQAIMCLPRRLSTLLLLYRKTGFSPYYVCSFLLSVVCDLWFPHISMSILSPSYPL